MAEKRDVYKVKPMTEGKRNVIRQLISEYNIETAKDIQEALKDLLDGTIQISVFLNFVTGEKSMGS